MRVLVLLVLITAAPLSGNDVPDTDPVRQMLTDERVMDELAEMVVLSTVLNACKGELAAFLVRDREGKLSLVRWPVDCAALRKTWKGVVPWNTVAIVHTHPDKRRAPSDGDLKESRRLTLPICVLTRAGISVADPAAEQAIALLDDPTWTNRTRDKRHLAAAQ